MSQVSQPPTSPQPQRPSARTHKSHGSRTFSFHSDKSGGSRAKEDLSESPREKARRDSIWKATSKANPNAAIQENQPGGMFYPAFVSSLLLHFSDFPLHPSLFICATTFHSFIYCHTSSWHPHKPSRPSPATPSLLMRHQSMLSSRRVPLHRCVVFSTEI